MKSACLFYSVFKVLELLLLIYIVPTIKITTIKARTLLTIQLPTIIATSFLISFVLHQFLYQKISYFTTFQNLIFLRFLSQFSLFNRFTQTPTTPHTHTLNSQNPLSILKVFLSAPLPSCKNFEGGAITLWSQLTDYACLFFMEYLQVLSYFFPFIKFSSMELIHSLH